MSKLNPNRQRSFRSKTAQQSVHLTCGILRHFRAFFWFRFFPAPKQNPRPHTRTCPLRGESAKPLAASIIRKKSEHKIEKDIKMSETNQKSFNAIIQKEGKFIFLAIPFSPREVWGSKPRYSVAGDINGIAVRGTLGALARTQVQKGDYYDHRK